MDKSTLLIRLVALSFTCLIILPANAMELEPPSPEGFRLHLLRPSPEGYGGQAKQDFETSHPELAKDAGLDVGSGPKKLRGVCEKLDAKWRDNNQYELNAYLPTQITLLDYDEPISDELLAALNPKWIMLKERLSQEQKNELLDAALNYPISEGNHDIERVLVAIAVSIGAEPNPNWESNMECYIGGKLFLVTPDGLSALDQSVFFDDYHLVEYLLKKKANPNTLNIKQDYAIQYATSVKTTKLLFAYGAIARDALLNQYMFPHCPAELMELYFSVAGPQNLFQGPLHTLLEYEENENQIQKAHLLLNAGFHSRDKDQFGYTVFHYAAGYKRPQFCNLLIAQYVQKHHEFLEILWVIKQSVPWFYQQKDIRRLCFKDLSPIRKLRSILEMKDKTGKTAYDMWPNDELNPETCSYEKFRKLHQEKQEPILELEEIDL